MKRQIISITIAFILLTSCQDKKIKMTCIERTEFKGLEYVNQCFYIGHKNYSTQRTYKGDVLIHSTYAEININCDCKFD